MERTKDVYKYQPFYSQQYSFHFTVYMQSITMVTTESSRHSAPAGTSWGSLGLQDISYRK